VKVVVLRSFETGVNEAGVVVGGVNHCSLFTLSFGEIPWFDDKGSIRCCDWPRTAFFCMCPVTIVRLWVGFFFANHSAVFNPSHQTTDFRQMTV